MNKFKFYMGEFKNQGSSNQKSRYQFGKKHPIFTLSESWDYTNSRPHLYHKWSGENGVW